MLYSANIKEFLSTIHRRLIAHRSCLGRPKERTEREDRKKKIHRQAHTDYRLVLDQASKTWLLCFGAVIELKNEDVDYEFFDENGRTGITMVDVYGDGSINFAEEDMELDEDDTVFGISHHPRDCTPHPTYSHGLTSRLNKRPFKESPHTVLEARFQEYEQRRLMNNYYYR